MFVVVLSGGIGARLWPLSKQDNPKQFLNFNNKQSLLQKTVSRFLKCSDIQEIVISTNDQYHQLVLTELEKMDVKKCRIVSEPERKNTAPAIALSIRYLEEVCHAKATDWVLVLPSDHLIEPESVFLEHLELVKQAGASSQIITFGIPPTKPETGYGYIEIAERYDASIHYIKRFIEKPDRKTAEQYLASGCHYWNSGMFLFSIDTFWKQIKEHAPDIYSIAQGSIESLRKNYLSFPDISIDYAVMEKSRDILVCPLPVAWHDVGSWDSVYEALDKDLNQNVLVGNIRSIDTRNSLVFSDKKPIVTIGLEDLLIVETNHALLICKKGESQRIKNLKISD